MKCKVGDKVKLIDNPHCSGIVGEVVDVQKDGFYVKYDSGYGFRRSGCDLCVSGFADHHFCYMIIFTLGVY